MPLNILRKLTILILTTIFIIPDSNGQYLISGYLDTKNPTNTVYLSLLKFNEETMITNEQILFSTQTDSSGFFEFKGELLSKKDRLYRIHSNVDGIQGLQLIADSIKSNYHNFIFSNSDTIYFPKTMRNWFSQSTNTNSIDKEWRKLKSFEEKLIEDYSQFKNAEVKQQAVNDFSQKVKTFSMDSLPHPLVKLLAFADIKRNGFDLKNDFDEDPEFYNSILKVLKGYYSNTSYYLQYKDELSKISSVIVQQEYMFHKRLNYILGILVLALLIFSFSLVRKIKRLQPEPVENAPSNAGLTNQEEKIAKLILEDKSNKEIASELFISLSTVKTHIRNLYSKLEVSNRLELAEKFKNQP